MRFFTPLRFVQNDKQAYFGVLQQPELVSGNPERINYDVFTQDSGSIEGYSILLWVYLRGKR
jgi:hypothetical protein